MTLTDVVFEVGHPDDPLCRATERSDGAYAVARLTEPGRTRESYRSLLTFCAPQQSTAGLLRDLHGSRWHDDLEVLAVTPDTATIRMGLRGSEGAALAPLLPVGRLMEAFGKDAIFEPVFIRGGRCRVRVLLPRDVDSQRVLLSLRELQREVAWPEFRVVRVSSMDATHYADTLRRLLTPDQEDILRLAVDLGFYNIPKRATLDTIAKQLGLSVSPVHKRLKAIEGILVTAHVEPRNAERPDFRRRPRKGTALPKPAPLTDVALRVRCPRFAPNAWAARTPGARALLQPMHIDRASGDATALLVAMAAPDDYIKLLSELESNPAIRSMDHIGRDSDHVALKLRMPAPMDGVPVQHPYAWCLDAFSSDMMLKPVFMDGPDMYVRFLLLRPHTQQELLERVDRMAKHGGWDQHEILAVRPFAAHSSSAPMPAPDRLTPRQDEVLKIAFALGYYRTPRSCTLESVANTLGVSANAIHKNLAAAELNVITGYLSSGF